MNLILAIDTSCDETSAAVACGRRVLSNVISSQINIHKKYGGVYPALAKRAHEERIGFVVEEALRRAKVVTNVVANFSSRQERRLKPATTISAVAVTYGPGLAIALEVGIRKAKEIVRDAKTQRSKDTKMQRSIDEKQRCKEAKTKNFETLKLCFSASPRLIAVNHLEGHIYSCLAQNANGNPNIIVPICHSDENRNLYNNSIDSRLRPSIALRTSGNDIVAFPTLCLLVSGGHTELVLMKDHCKYQVLGATLDDACGEALDKAAKILHLGYPGGPIIERLAEASYKESPCGLARRLLVLTPPLKEKNNLNFSYSGLKTQFLYLVEKMSEKELGQNLLQLAFTFQEAAFEQLLRKTSQAIAMYQPKTLLCGGGVMANKYLRMLLRKLAKKNNLPVLFPPFKNLITDNAAMIGVAAYYKYQRKEFVKDIESLDREPRLNL